MTTVLKEVCLTSTICGKSVTVSFCARSKFCKKEFNFASGSLNVSVTKFPNLKQLTTDLKAMGFVVGMWVHPFINKNCQPYYKDAIDNNLVVKSHNGSTDTIWWNAGPEIGAAHWDFTKPEGRSFYRQKLEAIQETHGIDIFKFDAGETTWFPEDAVLTGDPNITPSQMTRAFVELASDFGNLLRFELAGERSDCTFLCECSTLTRDGAPTTV